MQPCSTPSLHHPHMTTIIIKNNKREGGRRVRFLHTLSKRKRRQVEVFSALGGRSASPGSPKEAVSISCTVAG